MTASEIRIGNWFHHSSAWSGINEDAKTDFDFQFQENHWYMVGECILDLGVITPIPLTEEWLEKFGFVSEICINGRRCFRSKIFGAWFVDINDKEGSFFLCIDGWEGSKFPYVISRDFKYVHHLQNLFFALTGEELTISDK